MIILGLTGSIGMGKSTAAAMLRRLGCPVHDADAAVHALYAKGGAAVQPVGTAFPGVVRDGAVDRSALAAQVVGKPQAMQRLEAIVHPLVRQATDRFLAQAARRRVAVAVLDIPLLFETRQRDRVDYVLVVSAPPFVQRARVLARPGMTADRLRGLMARQMPDAEKRRRADFVIRTGRGKGYALQALAELVTLLQSGNSIRHRMANPCAKSFWTPKPPALTRRRAIASLKSAVSS